MKIYQTTNHSTFYSVNQYCFAIIMKGSITRMCNDKIIKNCAMSYNKYSGKVSFIMEG